MFTASHAAILCLTLAAPEKPEFERIVIDPEFQAEACTAADLNNDGLVDIVAGSQWYEAPDWKPHPLRDVSLDAGYKDIRTDHAQDIDGDGLIDIMTVRRSGRLEWLRNPGPDQPGKWKSMHVGTAPKSEGARIADVNGDGLADFVTPAGGDGQAVSWWSCPSRDQKNWREHPVGKRGGDAHGIGTGDINRDGRIDIITTTGWYEAPKDPVKDQWRWHDLDRAGMHQVVVYDFDGDGDQDLVSALPHDFGLYLWTSEKTSEDRMSFKRKLIDDTISQLHAIKLADVDADGDMDIVTGKRYHAHHGRDPGAEESALLVWYELSRDGKTATFTRHTIDDDSGVGYTVCPLDIDRDGDIDVLTSNQKGVHLFKQKGSPKWLPIFNGQDLTGWRGTKDLWSVQDGAIVGLTETGLKHNDFLVSADEFSDFILTLEVRLRPDSANSGIQFRSTPHDDGEVEGYQADIGRDWWGSIYEELGRGLLHNGYENGGKAAVVPNAWNDYVVYAVGDRLRVEINGTVCTDIRDDKRDTGVLALQLHSGGPTDIRFRNIRMRAVTP